MVVLVTLAVAALVGATAFTANGASSSNTVKLSVPAGTKWMTTPVTLSAGESATISATGNISYGSGDPNCQGIPITADGCAAESGPVAGPAGALVGRIGAGQPFIVGTSKTVAGPGRISLGINDWETELGNNTGTLAVTITRGGQPKPPAPAPDAPALELLPRPQPGRETARIQAVAARVKGGKTSMTVTRGGRTYAADETSILQNGDVLRTDDGTVAAIEFLIGGRVGVNSSSEVELVNERSVADGQVGAKRGVLKSGSMWLKADANTLKQPIEIQTNGGTIGIRG